MACPRRPPEPTPPAREHTGRERGVIKTNESVNAEERGRREQIPNDD